MVENENLYEQEKVVELIGFITDKSIELKCNLLEVTQACRAVMVASLEMMGGNAREILLAQEQEENQSPQ